MSTSSFPPTSVLCVCVCEYDFVIMSSDVVVAVIVVVTTLFFSLGYLLILTPQDVEIFVYLSYSFDSDFHQLLVLPSQAISNLSIR